MAPKFTANKSPRKYNLVKPKALKTLMRLNPTLEDTAAFFEVSQRQIERIIRKEWDLTFVDFRRQNMVHTRLDLIRNALAMAKKGNPALMIFCLKNMCGWHDKHEINATTTINSIKIETQDVGL